MNDRSATDTGNFLEIMAKTSGHEIEELGSRSVATEDDASVE